MRSATCDQGCAYQNARDEGVHGVLRSVGRPDLADAPDGVLGLRLQLNGSCAACCYHHHQLLLCGYQQGFPLSG